MADQISVGVIGTGRFGRHYARIFSEQDQTNLSWICANTKKTLNLVAEKLPVTSLNKTTDYGEILQDSSVDAVAIATPGSTHYEITKAALEAGKDVLVEKPFCFSYKEAKELDQLATEQKQVLLVGHLHLFNPGINQLKKDILAGSLGDIHHLSFVHTGNGPIRPDMSALWDFGPHSIAIMLHLLGEMPLSVAAHGASFINKGNDDFITMNLPYQNGCFVSSYGSWIHPLKQMTIAVSGSQRYATFDDYADTQLAYHDGDTIETPSFEKSAPLSNQIAYFLDCVKGKEHCAYHLNIALNTTKILEAAQQSRIAKKPVKITTDE